MKLNWDKIDALVAERFIGVQKHPETDLWIYNYTQKTQFEANWTPETLACRGLIVDRNRNVIARPFPKFFNIEQHETLPIEPFEAFEKLDGSLGILYWCGSEPRIATRGSFISEQAQHATKILQRVGWINSDARKTYLFEIIYPGNRIVVNYGDREELVLLAVIDTATGHEEPMFLDGFQSAKRYDFTDLSAIQSLNTKNAEGFVVRFQSGLRVKIKFADYKRLHKILTGVTPRHVWEAMKTGTLETMLERVPDEFYQWVRKVETSIKGRMCDIASACMHEFKDLGDRKANAEYYKTCTHPPILFKILDGKDYTENLWKLVYPEPASTFKADEP